VQATGAVQYMAPEFLFLNAEDAERDEWFQEDPNATVKLAAPTIKTAAGDVFAYGRLILAVRSRSCSVVVSIIDFHATPTRSRSRTIRFALSMTQLFKAK
jgi:hypothetical protein